MTDLPKASARGSLVQRHPRRLGVVLPELQVLLHLVDDAPPPSVDAEVLERQLEVRDVRLHLHLEQLPGDQDHKEQDLLREREDQRAQSRDVGLQRFTCRKGKGCCCDQYLLTRLAI